MSAPSCYEKFHTILNGSICINPASVFDPLSARIAEYLGFTIGMFAGSTASLTILGAPDLVLITATEFAEQAHRICRATTLPLLVDADNGYGNALNVARTISELEAAGVAAATIEDTILPPSYGAIGRSGLISIEEGVGKMRAALAARRNRGFAVVGRTSAPILSNIKDTVARVVAYEQAGVDALFIVGLKTIADIDIIAGATNIPLILSNAAETLKNADLATRRVRISLQGHLPILAAARAIHDTMKALRDGIKPTEIGTTASTELMRNITRAADYEADARRYLSNEP